MVVEVFVVLGGGTILCYVIVCACDCGIILDRGRADGEGAREGSEGEGRRRAAGAALVGKDGKDAACAGFENERTRRKKRGAAAN